MYNYAYNGVLPFLPGMYTQFVASGGLYYPQSSVQTCLNTVCEYWPSDQYFCYGLWSNEPEPCTSTLRIRQPSRIGRCLAALRRRGVATSFPFHCTFIRIWKSPRPRRVVPQTLRAVRTWILTARMIAGVKVSCCR